MSLISFKENDISQIPALELLQKMGYQYLSPEEALELRGGKTSNVLLEEVLRRQLRELNSIRIGSHKEARFSEQNIENGITALRNVPMESGYLNGNEAVYNMLTLGKAFEQSIDGDKKSYTMRYIDWQHPENNVFHVTEEFDVTRTGSTDTYRPDIVLFVNGIPLVVIECKRPDVKGAEESHLLKQRFLKAKLIYEWLLFGDDKAEDAAALKQTCLNRLKDHNPSAAFGVIFDSPFHRKEYLNIYLENALDEGADLNELMRMADADTEVKVTLLSSRSEKAEKQGDFFDSLLV